MSARVDTAVIVAAGKGERLAGGFDGPKPLRPVVGVPLIARVMKTAERAGIEQFVVVIGHDAERMRRDLPLCAPAGRPLMLVENPRFEEPNGVSLQAAASRLEGAFALLMADHLFTPDRLESALRHFEQTGRNVLVVEDREQFSGDLEDATLVATADGRVTGIAKGLEPYDAVDTGMFVLDAAEVSAALDAADEAPSISDGMRVLAAEGRLDALDVTHGTWQDVDTPADLEAAERMLFDSLRKPDDGFLASHVNRRVSLAVTKRIWRLGVAPNVATLGTLLIGLAAGWVFAQGSSPFWGLLGATLFQLQSILDGVDGELARLMHKESRIGFWLDVSCDNLTHIAVFLGMAHGQSVDGAPGPWMWLGVLAALGVVASFAVMAPLVNRRERAPGGAADRRLQKLVDGLARRDFTYLLFPLAALGWLGGFVWAAAVGTWIYAATGLILRRQATGAGRAAA